MKRILYIIILSIATVLIITSVEFFAEKKEAPKDKKAEAPPPKEVKDFTATSKKTTGENLEYTLYADLKDSQGNDVKLKKSYIKVGKIRQDQGSRFLADHIKMRFYRTGLKDIRTKESDRLIAYGSSDRAYLYSEESSGKGQLDLKFKNEFILEKNVVIETAKSEKNPQSFRLLTHSLVVMETEKKNLVSDAQQETNVIDIFLSSEEEVTIEKEDLKITGTGMTYNPADSVYRLEKNITITGDLSQLSDFIKTSPEKEKKKDPETPSIVKVTADGPLVLEVVKPNPLEPIKPVEGKGTLYKLVVEKRIKLIHDNEGLKNKRSPFEYMDCQCDKLETLLLEKPDGAIELLSIKGLGLGTRTRMNMRNEEQDLKVTCQVLNFEELDKPEGKCLLVGAPEINNISASLPIRSSDKKAKFSFKCDKTIEITPKKVLEGPGYKNHVKLLDSVIVFEDKNKKNPLLRSDALSFDINSKEPGALSDERLPIENFHAWGNVSGTITAPEKKKKEKSKPKSKVEIEPITSFFYECEDFKCDVIKTETGEIANIRLESGPKDSCISCNLFSLYSSRFKIRVDEDVMEIRAFEKFVCNTSAFLKLPQFKTADLFAKAPPPDSLSKVKIVGNGHLRLLLRGKWKGENMGKSDLTITMENGTDYDIRLVRADEKGNELEEALRILGKENFNLVINSGQFNNLDLLKGGQVDGWFEDGRFSAFGDWIQIISRDQNTNSYDMDIRGENGTGLLTFTIESETAKIKGSDIQLSTGKTFSLAAKHKADVLFPGPMAALLTKKRDKGKKNTNDAFNKGPYRIRSDLFEMEQNSDEKTFLMKAENNVTISNLVLDVYATCQLFSLTHFIKNKIKTSMITLRGTQEENAVIRRRSGRDQNSFDSIHSSRIDLEMVKTEGPIAKEIATIHVFPNGRVFIRPSKVDDDCLSIFCKRDIILKDNYLECNGPVKCERRLGDQVRTMDCNKLFVYFLKSPILHSLSPMDYNAVAAMAQGQNPENAIKRIKAQDRVSLVYDAYNVSCALLSWDLEKDTFLCDGLGDKVKVMMDNRITMTGSSLLLNPMREEVSLVK